MLETNISELWFAFGTGKYLRYIAVHQIAKSLRTKLALPIFHALTGCDTVFSFARIGKKNSMGNMGKQQ